MVIVGNDSKNESITLDVIIQRAEEEEIQVAIEERRTGEKIVKVLKEGREYYLNSIYGEDLAECWCNQCDLRGYGTVVVLLGIANGEYIEKIKERNSDVVIILYEPSYSILYAAVECIGIGEFDEKTQNIYLCIGEGSLSKLYNTMDTLIGYENMKNVRIMVSPNYELIMEEAFERFRDICSQKMSMIYVNKNTMEMFKKEFIQNITDNIPDNINQYSLGDLKDSFDNIDLDEIPAVIVAAGPSLDKNIRELKNIKGKAFIVAVDTALKSLARENIIPDIAVTVDPHKPVSLFDNEKISHVPLIYSLGANADIKQVHKGMRIYQNDKNSILDKLIYKFEKKVLRLSTGGSVANDAFSLVQVLGFKTIIFIGLDLAYPNNKMHTDSAYEKESENYIEADSKKYIEVEDIYGNMVKTEGNMNIYRQWFEREIINYPDLKVIDATEGGAKKKGMEILTLSEAISRECRSEGNIDFPSIIASTKPYFSNEEKYEIIEYINNLSKEMDSTRKRMKEGIEAYDKLDEFNRRQKYTGKEFQNTMKRVADINRWLTDSKEMEYLQLYVAEDDYKIKGELYEEKENSYEDIKHMITSGKELINSMINATYQVEADMKQAAEKMNNI